MKNKEYDYVISSLLYVSAFFLMTYGYTLGFYIAATLFSLSIFAIIFVSSYYISLKSEKNKDNLMKFVLHIIMAITCYRVYTLGYVFFSGMFLTALFVTFFTNILNIFNPTEQKNE